MRGWPQLHVGGLGAIIQAQKRLLAPQLHTHSRSVDPGHRWSRSQRKPSLTQPKYFWLVNLVPM